MHADRFYDTRRPHARVALALALAALAITWLTPAEGTPDTPEAPSCVGCHSGTPEGEPPTNGLPFWHPQGGRP